MLFVTLTQACVAFLQLYLSAESRDPLRWTCVCDWRTRLEHRASRLCNWWYRSERLDSDCSILVSEHSWAIHHPANCKARHEYNTNQIYNARKVTPKCKSEAQIVCHQVKIQLTFQFLESQEEIASFELNCDFQVNYCQQCSIYSLIHGICKTSEWP